MREVCQNTFLEKSNWIKFIVTLLGKYHNTVFFLVCIFPYSNWIQKFRFSPTAEKHEPNKPDIWQLLGSAIWWSNWTYTSTEWCSENFQQKNRVGIIFKVKLWIQCLKSIFLHCFLLVYPKVLVLCYLLFSFSVRNFIKKAQDLAYEIDKNNKKLKWKNSRCFVITKNIKKWSFLLRTFS